MTFGEEGLKGHDAWPSTWSLPPSLPPFSQPFSPSLPFFTHTLNSLLLLLLLLLPRSLRLSRTNAVCYASHLLIQPFTRPRWRLTILSCSLVAFSYASCARVYLPHSVTLSRSLSYVMLFCYSHFDSLLCKWFICLRHFGCPRDYWYILSLPPSLPPSLSLSPVCSFSVPIKVWLGHCPRSDSPFLVLLLCHTFYSLELFFISWIEHESRTSTFASQ